MYTFRAHCSAYIHRSADFGKSKYYFFALKTHFIHTAITTEYQQNVPDKLDIAKNKLLQKVWESKNISK